MFKLFLCLPVYLTMASTERRVTAETCCQLYFVVKLFYFVCLFDQIAPTALAQWITNRLVIERLLWITSCETLGAAAELSLPSTEASKKNSSAFTSHPVGQTSDSTDALLFLDFDFQTFKMHNFILDICFELNGDDNWLSAQTGKTLTHMFCF